MTNESAKTKESRLEIAFGMAAKALLDAEKKFPGWPGDVVHASAIVSEEAGELTKDALDFYYGRYHLYDRMMKEAAQTAAVAVRFIVDILGRIDGDAEIPE